MPRNTRNPRNPLTLALVLALASTPNSHAAVASITINFNQNFEAPRWMYEPNTKPRGGELISLMVKAKTAQKNKDRGTCLTALQKVQSQGKSLAPWVLYNQMQCGLIATRDGKIATDSLSAAVQKVEARPTLLMSGPAAQLLRQSYRMALMGLLEAQVKSNRTAAWKNLDRLQTIENWMPTEERAQMYRWAGELAFIEQNLTAAQEFILRSLNAKESADLRAKLDSIRLTLAAKKKVEKTTTAPTAIATEDLGVSDDERDIYARMNRAIDSQEYVSAVEDGLTLLEKFPGSVRAQEAADKILDIYLSIASRTEEKFRHVRERVVKEMARGDATRMFRWANNAYARGNYVDALTLAEGSLRKFQTQPDSTKALLLAARAAYAAGEYSDAQSYFERLTKEHAGTPEAAEAIFRLGLLEFRRERYTQSLAYFERVAALTAGKDFNYRALYWQWRAQQKVNATKAPDLAKVLIQKYPFTYYGMRAQMEANQNSLTMPNTPLNIKVDLHLLESERMAWERALVLLKAGWFIEAQNEIEALPDAQSSEERLVRAKLWATAFRYDLASNMMSKVFDESPELAQPAALRVIYPKEYSTYFSRESKNYSIDENLARSLARQESSFRSDVKSPAGALGVMQLLPSTASEMAKELRLKNFTLPDSMLDPEVNIRLGTMYLSRMIRSFNGNVPMALAAYNTGPTRLRRWVAARKDLSQGAEELNSTVKSELWIDELPWDETSFYVKAVLRNLMIYRLLDNTTVKFGDPIWRN